jgi:cobalt-zinc-cadmium efflux system membrane fusion protein
LFSDNQSAPSEASKTESAAVESHEGHAHAADQAAIALDWCARHRVPESECTKCNPQLIAGFRERNDWCVEHGLPESHCRLCNPGLTFAQEPPSEPPLELASAVSVFFPANAKNCATSEAVIQFASAETAERAGINCVPTVAADRGMAAEAPAELVFDESRVTEISSPLTTRILKWLVEPGVRLTAGVAVAQLESPDMPELKSDYLQAKAEFRLRQAQSMRTDSLVRRGLISIADKETADRELQIASAQLSGAEGHLRACGMNADDLLNLTDTGAMATRWLFRAPTGGVMLERIGKIGQLVESGARLATIGDPSVLWIEARVRVTDLPLFRKGQVVEFSTDGNALGRIAGRVIWVSDYVDSALRTGVVRAEIANESGGFVAHQFGRLSLPQNSLGEFVAVPRDAVQWEGCCNVVFVREAIDRYRPHKVTLARGEPGYYTVTSGLEPGEMIVVQGSYLLKTELRKSSLGAGCCGVAPKS